MSPLDPDEVRRAAARTYKMSVLGGAVFLGSFLLQMVLIAFVAPEISAGISAIPLLLTSAFITWLTRSWIAKLSE